MNGVEKHIDKLGRVVLPIEFRNKLGLKYESKVIVSLENNAIHITPSMNQCVLCGSIANINPDFRICDICIKKIKRLN